MKDQFLLAMQDTGQIDIAGSCQLGHKVVHRGDAEAGYDLQVFFIAIVQIGKPRPHAQCVKDDVFPGIFLGERTDLLADRIKVERHVRPSPFGG